MKGKTFINTKEHKKVSIIEGCGGWRRIKNVLTVDVRLATAEVAGGDL